MKQRKIASSRRQVHLEVLNVKGKVERCINDVDSR